TMSTRDWSSDVCSSDLGKIVRTINLKRPWRRARYHDSVREVAGRNWFELSSEQRRERATHEFKLEILPQLADFEVTQHLFEKLIDRKSTRLNSSHEWIS